MVASSFVQIYAVFALLLMVAPAGWALRCFQAVHNLSSQLNITASECPIPNAYTCTKTVDLRSNLITRACQASNCTINSGSSYSISTSALCVNNSNTQTTFCCCYGNECNSSPSAQITGQVLIAIMTAMATLFGTFPIVMASSMMMGGIIKP